MHKSVNESRTYAVCFCLYIHSLTHSLTHSLFLCYAMFQAWCHATSPDMVSKWITHGPALMAGPWPGHQGVGGTGNVLPALTPAEQKRLNATHAVVTGGAVLWLSQDTGLQTFELIGSLGLPPVPAPNVRFCGDVHVFRHGDKWRVAGAGSNGQCMAATNASISPLLLLYEADALSVPLNRSAWR